MEVQTIQRYIHTSPRKLRLVADMVRKLEPGRALEALRFTNKASAEDLSKAIKTALANAKQKGMKSVSFQAFEINEGPRLKRFRASARGRARPYKRRMSHIKIVLSDDLKLKAQMTNVKTRKQMEGGGQKEVAVDPSVNSGQAK